MLSKLVNWLSGASEEFAKQLESAKRGNVDAQTKVGQMYAKGEGVGQDYKEARLWLRTAAEKNNSFAQWLLGGMYLNGYGGSVDYEEAEKWTLKAAEQGNSMAQFLLGSMYYGGQGIPKDTQKALVWLQRAAVQGFGEAQYILGCLCRERGDNIGAYVWAKICASEGDNRAIELCDSILGRNSFLGDGSPDAAGSFAVVASKSKAKELLKGNPGLLQKFLRIRENDRNHKTSVLAVDRGAEQSTDHLTNENPPPVQVFSGSSAYSIEQKMSPSEIEAGRRLLRESLEKRAEMGDPKAQHDLGMMYHSGEGVPRDIDEALRWFLLAAERGNADAQFRIGVMCCEGIGVKKNIETAMSWLFKSANQGNADAQYHLVMIFRDGQVGPQDLIQAYMWFALSRSLGHDKGEKALASISAFINSYEIEEGRRLSHEWVPKRA